ncbi:hypothetical protein HK096_003023 [Nowakowskiella sp. JEL0078]|nr:hypothetical protein HK096_003023 [Nowakowskiella sp. JEL0078]
MGCFSFIYILVTIIILDQQGRLLYVSIDLETGNIAAKYIRLDGVADERYFSLIQDISIDFFSLDVYTQTVWEIQFVKDQNEKISAQLICKLAFDHPHALKILDVRTEIEGLESPPSIITGLWPAPSSIISRPDRLESKKRIVTEMPDFVKFSPVVAFDCIEGCHFIQSSYLSPPPFNAIYSKITYPNRKRTSSISLEGFWCGSYSDHGMEILLLIHDEELDTLDAYKVTGDLNVPRGARSWRANYKESKISLETKTGTYLLSEIPEFSSFLQGTVYSGEGTIAMPGYQGPIGTPIEGTQAKIIFSHGC